MSFERGTHAGSFEQTSRPCNTILGLFAGLPGALNKIAVGASELDALVRRTRLEKGKIAAIKLYRNRKPGVSLAEAKDYVDQIDATVPPGMKARSKPAGCLGLFVAVVVGLGLVCAIWSRS